MVEPEIAMTASFPQTSPPEILREWALNQLLQFRQASREQCGARDLCVELGEERVLRVFACSDFIAMNFIRHAVVVADLLDSGDLAVTYGGDDARARVARVVTDVANETVLAQQLRRVRRREMLRIAWRDLTGAAQLDETLHDLSALADACLDAALIHLERFATTLWGTPTTARGEAQRLCVIAMGKLGARELNFSSDIDLILAYPEEGETRDGPRQTSNSEYFIRLSQQLINALNQSTADGFVFRVDVRLRPFGDSGPLAMDFDAMEQYYQEHGREWERYALIKARICAGDRAGGERLFATLTPFVYRRYLDFGAFESLREMKNMIAQEVRRKGLANNVKLGAGGIREVEFIGQAFQLIRGGRQPALRERQIQKVLDLLLDGRYLPDHVVRELHDAYVFLRNSEHRIQQYADQQTHHLPADETGRARQAYAMGFADWPAYEAVLRKHMQRVHGHFDQVFAAPQTDTTGNDRATEIADVWAGDVVGESADRVLTTLGYTDTAGAQEALSQLRRSSAFRNLGQNGQQRMNQLIPLALGAAGGTAHAAETLQRVLRLIEAIARRTAYLSLLVENPMALSQLVKLCSASPWIAELLSRHPVLLDELLDPRVLYAPPDAAALRTELAQRLSVLTHDDLEQQMETLRQFKQANVLRVAAADIADALPLMEVSDHLSWIAETVVSAAVDIAWRELAERHGVPVCSLDGAACEQGFAVIAYGKLGGLELGYSSDLDLVFLYATPDDAQLTPGDKPIQSSVFFSRLGQRIIHILTAHTPSGILYEVDLRLRPSGASGLLVSPIAAYADYQQTEAWTWEHQALVRARPIVGDAIVVQRFAAIRQAALTRPRDLATLRSEVRDMREKMRASFKPIGNHQFDLKQGPGGIVDIEFLVQFGVLAFSGEHSALLDYTDNIRLLDELAKAGKLSVAEARWLSDAYRTYRARQHKLALLSVPAIVDGAEYEAQRAGVVGAWQRILE